MFPYRTSCVTEWWCFFNQDFLLTLNFTGFNFSSFSLSLNSQSSKEALSEVNATGVAMLFSAGTFLYVATVHVLPEVGGMGHSHKSDPTGGRGLSRLEVAALVLGCLIPLILSVGHQH